MTCNDRDCESCNPLYHCEKHDVDHRWYEECYMCEEEGEGEEDEG